MTQFFNYLASTEEIESSRTDTNEKLTREKNQKGGGKLEFFLDSICHSARRNLVHHWCDSLHLVLEAWRHCFVFSPLGLVMSSQRLVPKQNHRPQNQVTRHMEKDMTESVTFQFCSDSCQLPLFVPAEYRVAGKIDVPRNRALYPD